MSRHDLNTDADVECPKVDNKNMNNLPNKNESSWNGWYIAVAAVLIILILFFYFFTQQFA